MFKNILTESVWEMFSFIVKKHCVYVYQYVNFQILLKFQTESLGGVYNVTVIGVGKEIDYQLKSWMIFFSFYLY